MIQVIIERNFIIHAAIHFSNEFFVNTYEINAIMNIQTDSSHAQQIAMERVNYLLANEFEHILFINKDESEMIEKYSNSGIRICELFEDPYDQIIGMTLLQKMNSVLDGRIRIVEMTIGSLLGDGIVYRLDADTVEESLAGNHWWNKPDLSMTETDTQNEPNVVKLFVQDEWDILNLSWKETV